MCIRDREDTISVFGSFDENIRLIEAELGVSVVNRDAQLKISGEDPEKVMYAARVIENLMTCLLYTSRCV